MISRFSQCSLFNWSTELLFCHLARMDLSFPFQLAAKQLQRCCNLIVTAMLHCLAANSLTSSLFPVCFLGSPEGGSLYWQVLGIHVWAEHPCNVSLCHLSPFFISSKTLLFIKTRLYGICSLFSDLPLRVLSSLSCSFYSISLHSSCIHIASETGRYSFFQLCSLIKIIPCSPPTSHSAQSCFLCFVARLKPHISLLRFTRLIIVMFFVNVAIELQGMLYVLKKIFIVFMLC